MNIDLSHKKALIGGSTQGLGKAIAMQMASCGASVTLMARNEEKLKEVLSDLPTSRGQQHQYLVVDFYEFEDCKSKVTEYFKHHTVDILVNNTNGPKAGTIEQKTLEDFNEAYRLLFETNCFTTLKAIENMKKNGFGRIINVSSMTVKEPNLNLVLSNTMRTAWLSFNKSLSVELGPYGITVNSILTGLFDTARIKSLNAHRAEQSQKSIAEIEEKQVADIPVKRLGKPEEYGYLAAFLASDFAAYLTGASIPLDGGSYKGLY